MPLYDLRVWYLSTPDHGPGTEEDASVRFEDGARISAIEGDEERPHGPGASKARIFVERRVAQAASAHIPVIIERWQLADEDGEIVFAHPPPRKRR